MSINFARALPGTSRDFSNRATSVANRRNLVSSSGAGAGGLYGAPNGFGAGGASDLSYKPRSAGIGGMGGGADCEFLKGFVCRSCVQC